MLLCLSANTKPVLPAPLEQEERPEPAERAEERMVPEPGREQRPHGEPGIAVGTERGRVQHPGIPGERSKVSQADPAHPTLASSGISALSQLQVPVSRHSGKALPGMIPVGGTPWISLLFSMSFATVWEFGSSEEDFFR